MRGFSIPRQLNRRIQIVLVLVCVAALLVPQFTWAADVPAGPRLTCTGLRFSTAVNLAGNGAACSHYANLLELYRSGQLEYHAPGR
jgi:hypothetical protein